jgi:glyoxylase-like metal-dependent hydrolase (beta-lactamase superfamily II)
MRQVVPDVYLMEGLRGANVYLLVPDRHLTLIDTGLPGDADRILDQILQSDRHISELRTIVLTHAHGDHIGGARELMRRTGAEVIAHRDEVPYVERTASLPSSSFLQRTLNWLMGRLLFRTPGCVVDRPVEEGDVIHALGGLRVIHTGGHTPGSISLYQPDREILFCGDALFNAHPMSGKPGLQLPIRAVTVDQGEARRAVGRLAELPVQVLCCGHGDPIVEGAQQKIKALL